MTRRLKNSAGPTSIAASTNTSVRGLFGRGTLQVLMGVSIMTMAASTIGSDSDGYAAKAHDVGAQTEEIHAQISDQDAKWQSDNCNQRAAYMEQEDDADQGDDDAFLCQRTF